MRDRAAAGLCAALAVIMLAPVARADIRFMGDPLTLADGVTQSSSGLAMDAAGDAIALYGNQSSGAIVPAYRPAGGRFAPLVSALASSGGAADTRMQVVMDARGDALAVWDDHSNPPVRVMEAARPAGGAWSTPVAIWTAPSGAVSPLDPHVAIAADGSGTAVWVERDATDKSTGIGLATLTAAGVATYDGGASSPFPMSRPRVAVDAANHWLVLAAVSTGYVYWSTVNVAGAFDNSDAAEPAIDSHGNAVVLLRRTDVPGIRAQYAANFNQSSPSWSDAGLATGGGTPHDISLAVDGAGNFTAAWTQNRGDGGNEVQVSTLPAGGSQFGQDESLATALTDDPAAEVRVAGGAGSAAIVAWSLNGVVSGASRGVGGGSFSAPQQLSSTYTSVNWLNAAMDGTGRGLVDWNAQTQAGSEEIGFTPLDDVPRITPSIPTTAIVGQPVSLSAELLDPWTAIATANWSFGDGQQSFQDLGGAADPHDATTGVTHTFAQVGIYTVALTAMDAPGNTQTVSRQLTVTAPGTSGKGLSGTGPGGTASGGTGPGATGPGPLGAPLLSGLTISPSQFASAPTGPSALMARARPRRRTGTVVSFALSESASVAFQIERRVSVRRRGAACAARRSPRCSRLDVVGGFRWSARQGANRMRFTGRLAGRSLPPGRYVLVARPTDSAGRNGLPRSASFTLTRR